MALSDDSQCDALSWPVSPRLEMKKSGSPSLSFHAFHLLLGLAIEGIDYPVDLGIRRYHLEIVSYFFGFEHGGKFLLLFEEGYRFLWF